MLLVGFPFVHNRFWNSRLLQPIQNYKKRDQRKQEQGHMQVRVLEQLVLELVQQLPLHVLRVAGQRQRALRQGRQVVRPELQPQLTV